jgi:hypothetical protein
VGNEMDFMLLDELIFAIANFACWPAGRCVLVVCGLDSTARGGVLAAMGVVIMERADSIGRAHFNTKNR